jgi:pimeloyl-ACP methyl ester carboxylesterase
MSRGILGAPLALLLIALTAIGCGGEDLDINPSGPKPALLKWGKPSDGKPQGVVILLHGGGFQPNRFAYEAEMPLAAAIQDRGFATVVIGYDAGETGYEEIEGIYEKARKRYKGLPVCVHGISAGGTLGLILAANEPDLSCMVGLVTPTDLTTLQQQGADQVYDLAVAAFGEDELAKWSPVRYADQIKAKVLLIPAQTDPVVPIAQAREFVRARPATELSVIPPGPTPVDWLHGADTTAAGAQQAVERGFDFIEQEIGS